MSGLKRTTEKNLMVFSGRAHPELAEEVAQLLGTGLVPTSAYEFANSEIYVRFEESVRGSDAFVIQSHTAPVNEWIMEHLIMVDALKRASAKRITVVMPFYGYARQDKKHRGREPISARLMADLFKTAGADRLITVDLHTAQIQGFFDGPVDHLMAIPILSEHVLAKYGDEQLAVVSPDAGRIKVAEQWSNRLGGAPLAFIHKTRDIDRPNESVANRVVGDVTDRICVLVDDMIDTGGTIVKATEALMNDGAAGVVIAATHAILSDPAVDRLKNCPAARDRGHQHAADPPRAAVRQAHLPVHRPADQPGDPRGLRGRLGHQPLRRPRPVAAPRFASVRPRLARLGQLPRRGRVRSVIDAVVRPGPRPWPAPVSPAPPPRPRSHRVRRRTNSRPAAGEHHVSESHIEAEPRTEFGKGAARRIRRAAKVPAVLYGHGGDPVHITLPGHDTMLALKHGGVNALLTINVDGKEQLALPKQIQRDPIKGFLEHLDLIIVRKGEKVTVDIPVHLFGEADPDALVVTETSTISVEAEATNIPEYVEVSIEGLTVGDTVLAKDLKVPERLDGAARRRRADRQRHPRPDRRGGRGGARRGRGRGRHRARRVRRGAGRGEATPRPTARARAGDGPSSEE